MGPESQLVVRGRNIAKCDCCIIHTCHYISAMHGQLEYKNKCKSTVNQLVSMNFIIQYEFL